MRRDFIKNAKNFIVLAPRLEDSAIALAASMVGSGGLAAIAMAGATATSRQQLLVNLSIAAMPTVYSTMRVSQSLLSLRQPS